MGRKGGVGDGSGEKGVERGRNVHNKTNMIELPKYCEHENSLTYDSIF